MNKTKLMILGGVVTLSMLAAVSNGEVLQAWSTASGTVTALIAKCDHEISLGGQNETINVSGCSDDNDGGVWWEW